MNMYLEQARRILDRVRGSPLQCQVREQQAIELATLMLESAQKALSGKDWRQLQQMKRMMDDPVGKIFLTQMTDQCFRSSHPQRIADQLQYLLGVFGIPRFLSMIKRMGLVAFHWFGSIFPGLLVPLVKQMARFETRHVILPGEPVAMHRHMRKRQKEGVRLNLNHLGEAILGEEEAERRLQIYLDDLADPQIEYISVKISTICSQLNLLAWEETLERLAVRLRQLYRAARNSRFMRIDGTTVPKFVNLDMEEYRDLALTVALFKKVLEEPEFFGFSAGIVLQSYLPDSYPVQQQLTQWALKRVADGGAPIKIRIVKGANLAMERVEAALRGWKQAPYLRKRETDANFKRMVNYGCLSSNAQAVHLGIGSHNLLDIAYAMILRAENEVEQWVEFEMLEGMANHLRQVVHRLTDTMLLYCPVAAEREFQNAVAYLVRRLDENTAPENFLRHMFGLSPKSPDWQQQVTLFLKACEEIDQVSDQPRRLQNRLIIEDKPLEHSSFHNEPDTDWSLAPNRKWAHQILSEWKSKNWSPIPLVISGESITSREQRFREDPSDPSRNLYAYSLAQEEHLEKALQTAKHAEKKQRDLSVHSLSKTLANVAQEFRNKRGQLIGAMVADTAKTIPEADIEVSEAIDFLEYYRRNAEEWATFEDIHYHPKGTILVAPPWNFPCSIPVGGIAAALATGNCVIFKPAQESIAVGWEVVNCFWRGGVEKDVLQFFLCADEPIGTQLVKDPRVDAIVLTGGTDTARQFLRMRPGVDLIAETGGKNTLIITSMADRDLAIRDLIQSAFGHSGQKCSACSLAILEAEVYDDPHFRRQLADAVKSLPVGSAWNPATQINPLIREANPILLRGLTQLEESESWLLQPKQDSQNPRLWSPGIKWGVQPGSFTHQTELFGPVLGVMRADNLDHAIALANHTPYGLTAGIHSLDEREQEHWMDHIEAGNCYVNRTITGAIVQRQPFGGCKASSFGRGAKAGGPNYLTQLVTWEEKSLPSHRAELSEPVEALTKFAAEALSADDFHIWLASVGNFAFYWTRYFRHYYDPSQVLGQDNILEYLPRHDMAMRIQKNDSSLDIWRVIGAVVTCGSSLEISCESEGVLPTLAKWPEIRIVEEMEAELIKRLPKTLHKRFRILSKPSMELEQAFAQAGCHTLQEPVSANGRIELLNYVREVSLSMTYHRYGNLGIRELIP